MGPRPPPPPRDSGTVDFPSWDHRPCRLRSRDGPGPRATSDSSKGRRQQPRLPPFPLRLRTEPLRGTLGTWSPFRQNSGLPKRPPPRLSRPSPAQRNTHPQSSSHSRSLVPHPAPTHIAAAVKGLQHRPCLATPARGGGAFGALAQPRPTPPPAPAPTSEPFSSGGKMTFVKATGHLETDLRDTNFVVASDPPPPPSHTHRAIARLSPLARPHTTAPNPTG